MGRSLTTLSFKFQYDNTLSELLSIVENAAKAFKFQYDNTLRYVDLDSSIRGLYLNSNMIIL